MEDTNKKDILDEKNEMVEDYFFDEDDDKIAEDYFFDEEDIDAFPSEEKKLENNKTYDGIDEEKNFPQDDLDELSNNDDLNELEDTENLDSNEKQNDKKGGHKKLIISFSVTLGVLLLIYILGVVVFSRLFQKNTIINGSDCSFKTVEAVKKHIKQQFDGYEIVLKERNNKKEKIIGKNIDIKYKEDNQVDKLLEKQNPYKWPCMFLGNDSQKSVKASISFSESKLNNSIENLDALKIENQKEPTNAEIIFSDSKKKFEIKKENNGFKLNLEKLKKVIAKAISENKKEIDLEKARCYEEPKIKSNDTNLNNTLKIYNKVCNNTIIYKLGDKTKAIDGPTLVSWLQTGDDGKAYFDESKVRAWVVELADSIDTVGSARTFIGADGGQYSVEGGTYGWKVDQDSEVQEILRLLDEKSTSQEREPIYESKGATFAEKGKADWGNTYAEVNLSTQHMFYVKDGQVVFETDVITGLPTPEKETTPGVFSILEKEENKTLVGDIKEDGKPEYETPVAYWMRVTWSGIGFHTATWQPAFGGDLYLTLGSHGCINMSYEDSQTLYGLIQVHDPVVVHK